MKALIVALSVLGIVAVVRGETSLTNEQVVAIVDRWLEVDQIPKVGRYSPAELPPDLVEAMHPVFATFRSGRLNVALEERGGAERGLYVVLNAKPGETRAGRYTWQSYFSWDYRPELSHYVDEQARIDDEIGQRKLRELISQEFIDFPISSVSGEILRVCDRGAKVTIVNIWALNCPPCVAEMPELSELQRKLSSRGVSIVCLSSDPIDRVARFARDRGFEMTLATSLKGGRIPVEYDLGRYPAFFVLDQSRKIRFARFGAPAEELEKAAMMLIAEAEQKTAQPGATDNPDDAQRLREDH